MKEGRRHNITYTQVRIITKVKALPTKMVTRAKNLANLDFLKSLRISQESLSASIENYPQRPKVPITQMNHNAAIGMQILNSTEDKTLDFLDMNSPVTRKRKCQKPIPFSTSPTTLNIPRSAIWLK